MKQWRAQTVAELRLLARNGEQLLLTIGIPVMLLVFFSVVDVLPTGEGDAIDFLLPGVLAIALMSTAMVSLGIATGFETSRCNSTWSTPAHRRETRLCRHSAVCSVHRACNNCGVARMVCRRIELKCSSHWFHLWNGKLHRHWAFACWNIAGRGQPCGSERVVLVDVVAERHDHRCRLHAFWPQFSRDGSSIRRTCHHPSNSDWPFIRCNCWTHHGVDCLVCGRTRSCWS